MRNKVPKAKSTPPYDGVPQEPPYDGVPQEPPYDDVPVAMEAEPPDPSRLHMIELLAQQRWPIDVATPANYISLYYHHEALVTALQLALQTLPLDMLKLHINVSMRCSECGDYIPASVIPVIRQGFYLCITCDRNLYGGVAPGAERHKPPHT